MPSDNPDKRKAGNGPGDGAKKSAAKKGSKTKSKANSDSADGSLEAAKKAARKSKPAAVEKKRSSSKDPPPPGKPKSHPSQSADSSLAPSMLIQPGKIPKDGRSTASTSSNKNPTMDPLLAMKQQYRLSDQDLSLQSNNKSNNPSKPRKSKLERHSSSQSTESSGSGKKTTPKSKKRGGKKPRDQLSPLPAPASPVPPTPTSLTRTVTPGAQRVGEGASVEYIPPPTALRAAMSQDSTTLGGGAPPTPQSNRERMQESGITEFSVEDWNDDGDDDDDHHDDLSTIPEPTSLRPGQNFVQRGAFAATNTGSEPAPPPSTRPRLDHRRSSSNNNNNRGSDPYLIQARLVEDDPSESSHDGDLVRGQSQGRRAQEAALPSDEGGGGVSHQETRQPRLVEAKLFDDEERAPRRYSRSTIVLIVLVVAVLVAGAVAVVFLLVVAGGGGDSGTVSGNDNNIDTNNSTEMNDGGGDNSTNVTLTATELLVESLPDSTKNDLQQSSTPQSKALAWLEGDSLFEGYSLEQQQQRFALATLYYATGGDEDDWYSSDFWLDRGGDTDPNECNWFAYADENLCNNDGLYVDLSLQHNRLEGSIPKELALLQPSLTNLELSRNSLFGSIPAELSGLAQLTSMDLSINELEGELPSVLPPALEFLYLEGNYDLEGGIPSTWGNMTSLQGVDLRATGISGSVPPEVCVLIEQNDLLLALDCEKITCDCDCFCEESGAYFPSVLNALYDELPDYTQEALIDPESPQSRAMDWMRKDPQVSEWPAFKVGQRFALATFYFALNGDDWFDQDDSPWLSYELDECDWYTDSTFYPCTDGRFDDLELNNMGLRSELPLELGLLTDLGFFGLTSNSITGAVPTTIGNLVGLFEISLDYNFLTDELPTELGLLVNLVILDFDYNDITGTIPTQLGNLQELQHLLLRENALTGVLPESLGNLTKMQFLYLGINDQLGGEIPSSFVQHQDINDLQLNNMDLTGNISAQQWQAWSGIDSLNLGANRLSGRITTEIGLLRDMTFIDLYQNEFTGLIPTQMGELENLVTLYLESNIFEGNIPTELAQITGLELLHVHDNNLEGTVPEEICERVRNHDLELKVDCSVLHCPLDCECLCADEDDEPTAPSPTAPYPTTPSSPTVGPPVFSPSFPSADSPVDGDDPDDDDDDDD